MGGHLGQPGGSWRPLEPKELVLLEALTALDFKGAAALGADAPVSTS